MATEVLGQTDPNGKIVAADALHTVTATAEFICDHGGEFMLPAKENRKTLFDALPWEQVQVAHAECSIGTNPQPDLADPHAAQIGGS